MPQLCVPVQSQFPDVNDVELKEMESRISDLTQKHKDAVEIQRRLDAGLSVKLKLKLIVVNSVGLINKVNQHQAR